MLLSFRKMFESIFKQKLYRAKKQIIKKFEFVGYKVEKTSGVFHLQAFRNGEIRKIRIVLGEISEEDRKKVKEYTVSTPIKREIWCLLSSGQFKVEVVE